MPHWPVESSKWKAVLAWAPARLNWPASPGRRAVPAQVAQAIADLLVGEGLEGFATGDLVTRGQELHGAGAVPPDAAEQRERIAGGDLEPLGPPGEGLLVVGKQSPQERLDRLAIVGPGDRWHRERQRDRDPTGHPFVIVGKREPAARRVAQFPHSADGDVDVERVGGLHRHDRHRQSA